MELNNSQKEILKHARECLKTPFRHQGRICGKSLDCAGVIIHVAKSLGFSPEDIKAYGRSPSRGTLMTTLDSQSCIYQVCHMLPGDILLMKFGSEPQHLAIYTDANTIIHGYSKVGYVCEHRLSSMWKGKIVKIYRFKV